jgi:hypothetical protein
MANPKKHSRPPQRLKIAVGFVIAVLFALGLLQMAQGFIDTRNYSEQVIAELQKLTHRKASIKGTVSVTLLPTPTLYIPGLELRDPASDKPAPSVTVNMTSIQVPLTSIFSEKLQISDIILDNPMVEITQAEDSNIYLDWLSPSLISNLSSETRKSGGALRVVVNDGKLLFRDSSSDKAIVFDNIFSTISNGASSDAGGSFRIAGHAMNFTLGISAGSGSAGTTVSPFTLRVTSGARDYVELKGELDSAGELPALKGSLAMNVENAPAWMKALKPREQALLEKVSRRLAKDESDRNMLPLELKSDWESKGLDIRLQNLTLQGLSSGGAGAIDLSWKEWRPNLLVKMKFSALSYDHWAQLAQAAFAKGDSETIVYREVNEAPDNPIPQHVNIQLELAAEEIYYGQQVWKDAVMSTSIGEGAITINQLDMKLQGDSRLSVFGVISPAATGDLRFEGSMETSGRSLRESLTVFDETAADLPETGFGKFSAHSNMFISSEQLRLSEADVKLGDLRLNGGLVAYFDSTPRVEADIKLKNISFDYFRDVWRERQKESDRQEDFFLKFDRSMSFSWLKKLTTAIDFKVYVQNFTFLERNGDNASFRLYAKNGDLGIYDINFIYPGDITRGYFKLNVNGEQPALLLNLTTSALNSDYFNVEPYRPAPVKLPLSEIKPSLANDVMSGPAGASEPMLIDASAPAVSRELMPLPALPASATDDNAATAVSEAKATEPAGATAPAADTRLEVEEQAHTFQIAAAGEEVVPPRPAGGIEDLIRKKSASDTKKNLHENKKGWSEKLLDMSWLNGFSGELELNVGRLTHKDLAFNNLKLKSSFGKDLVLFKTLSFSYWGGQCSILGSLYGGKVPGFSISFTIVDAQVQPMLSALANRNNISGQVSVSATLNSSGVNLLSWVSQAEGKMVIIGRNIYVQGVNMQGVVDSVSISRTAADVLSSVNRSIFNGFTIFSVDGNLNIKNGMIRTPGIGLRTSSTIGNLTGELRLVPWTLEMSALFQFPSMSTETVPTMTVQYSGTPESGEMKTDTSSLESFVAKRIISQ